MADRPGATQMQRREPRSVLCELQKISKRESRGYLGVAPRGDPLFAEEIERTADGTGFEFRGIALSPTVQQAGPARGSRLSR